MYPKLSVLSIVLLKNMKCMPESVAKSLHSCLTLCNPLDCSPLHSSVHGIFRQAHWNGLPFPPPGNRPDLGIQPMSPALQADSLPAEPLGKPIVFVVLPYSKLGGPFS